MMNLQLELELFIGGFKFSGVDKYLNTLLGALLQKSLIKSMIW